MIHEKASVDRTAEGDRHIIEIKNGDRPLLDF
jgi:hypothetical protein